MLLTGLDSTVPSESKTWSVLVYPTEPPWGKSVSTPAVPSTVICPVVAEAIRPPLLRPAFNGSATSITCPGRTKTPASKLQVKLTTSVSWDSL